MISLRPEDHLSGAQEKRFKRWMRVGPNDSLTWSGHKSQWKCRLGSVR